jgi:hypothetical protein
MNPTAASQQIETWPIDRLVEYPRNPRKNDKAVDRMCESIREFGFKIPCLIRSDGEVVDGHLRPDRLNAHALLVPTRALLVCPKEERALVRQSWRGLNDPGFALSKIHYGQQR